MRRVELSPRAREQVLRIDEWWRANRPAAGTLFAEELAAIVGRLEASESPGTRYAYPLFEVRRVLLAGSRYHVFYSVEGDVVKVRAVWHSSRGNGPSLR